jgi:hypothetical protein
MTRIATLRTTATLEGMLAGTMDDRAALLDFANKVQLAARIGGAGLREEITTMLDELYARRKEATRASEQRMADVERASYRDEE